MSLKLKGRHPLKDKDRDQINDQVEAWLGIRPLPEDEMTERGRADVFEVALAKGKVYVILEGVEGMEQPLPTLRPLVANRPEKAWVTVDMGAVPHLRNGADVMSPGITEADPGIQEGDLVWVRDIEHGMPLAIGRALLSGEEMAQADKGKAIETIHFVGDELWNIGK